MQNGLAVKADQIDRGATDGVRREKGFDRFRMTAGDHGVGQRQAARPRAAIVERCRLRDRAAQQCAIRLAVGKKSSAAKRDDLLPVGLDDRDIDTIHRGAAHQAYRADCSNWLSPSGPLATFLSELFVNRFQRPPLAKREQGLACRRASRRLQHRHPVRRHRMRGENRRGHLRSSLTIRLSFVGVHIYAFVWSSPFRPNLRAAARCIAAPFPLNLTAS
jgi:hypothetical protein